MRRFDPSQSLLAGMDQTVLRAQLARMQQDYLDIVSGRKVESASYNQGEGGKAVTFNKASLPQLQQAIRLLQTQLGIIDRPRRAMGVRF